MNLAVERHNERLYLVAQESVTSENSVLLAVFESQAAVETYKAAITRMLLMAHSAGASGI